MSAESDAYMQQKLMELIQGENTFKYVSDNCQKRIYFGPKYGRGTPLLRVLGRSYIKGVDLQYC